MIGGCSSASGRPFSVPLRDSLALSRPLATPAGEVERANREGPADQGAGGAAAGRRAARACRQPSSRSRCARPTRRSRTRACAERWRGCAIRRSARRCSPKARAVCAIRTCWPSCATSPHVRAGRSAELHAARRRARWVRAAAASSASRRCELAYDLLVVGRGPHHPVPSRRQLHRLHPTPTWRACCEHGTR